MNINCVHKSSLITVVIFPIFAFYKVFFFFIQKIGMFNLIYYFSK